jgi:hypothetical protein
VISKDTIEVSIRPQVRHGNVVVLSRDVATGLIRDVLVEMELEGNITTLVFNEVGAVNGT